MIERYETDHSAGDPRRRTAGPARPNRRRRLQTAAHRGRQMQRRAGGGGKFSWLQSVEKSQNEKIISETEEAERPTPGPLPARGGEGRSPLRFRDILVAYQCEHRRKIELPPRARVSPEGARDASTQERHRHEYFRERKRRGFRGASVAGGAAGHPCLVAGGELSVGRSGLSSGQPAAARAAQDRERQAAPARPLGHDARVSTSSMSISTGSSRHRT